MTPLGLDAHEAVEDGLARAAAWDRPDLSILRDRSPPPPLPFELLDAATESVIRRVGEATCSPPDYAFGALLASVVTVIGNTRVVACRDWTAPAVLWAVVIGDPSAGKSPAIGPFRDALATIEARWNDDYSQRILAHEIASEAADEARERWKGEVRDAQARGVPPPLAPEAAVAPSRPERRTLVMGDTTAEKVARVAASNPRGVAIVRDELAGFIGGFNAYKGGRGGDRAMYIEAYEGKPYTVHRVKEDAPIVVARLSVSILGGIQPDRLQEIIDDADDGFLPRCALVWPDPAEIKRPTVSLPREEIAAALQRLADLPTQADDRGELLPIVIRLADEAIELPYELWGRLRHGEDDASGPLKGFIGKARGLALRLALVIAHLPYAFGADDEPPAIISAADMEAACTLVETYFLPMAARAFGEAALPQAWRDGARLARWIHRIRPGAINGRELVRGEIKGAPSFNKDVARAKTALAFLEDAGWIRHDSKVTGGRRRLDYSVNPAVLV